MSKAYQEGVRAFHKGHTLNCSQYRNGSTLHQQWSNGWYDAWTKSKHPNL